jgi:hypothetical protein
MKSADQLMREAATPIELDAVETVPPPLRIRSGDDVREYRLRRSSTDDLLGAQRRFHSLAQDGSDMTSGALAQLLAVYMEPADAQRLLREQGPATVHFVLRTLAERTAREISKET